MVLETCNQYYKIKNMLGNVNRL